MEWIEVVDTTVKIGLAAAISGIVAYGITKLNHRNERSKELRKRRRELLEEVAEKSEILFRNSTFLNVRIRTKIQHEAEGRPLPDWLNKSLADGFSSFDSVIAEAIGAEARLRLLGEGELSAKLFKVVAAVSECFGMADGKQDIDVQKLQDSIKAIEQARNVFLKDLSDSYLRT